MKSLWVYGNTLLGRQFTLKQSRQSAWVGSYLVEDVNWQPKHWDFTDYCIKVKMTDQGKMLVSGFLLFRCSHNFKAVQFPWALPNQVIPKLPVVYVLCPSIEWRPGSTEEAEFPSMSEWQSHFTNIKLTVSCDFIPL